MRRVLPILGGVCLVVLLCGAGVVFARGAEDDSVPPGATNMRIERRGLSHMHISYRVPPNWTLLDLYAYLGQHEWTRDQLSERSLQQRNSWTADSNMTFAIFTRQSLFGLVSEVAIVGLAPDGQVRPLVRLIRCFKIASRTSC